MNTGEWKLESFYFGGAVWPSETLWRTDNKVFHEAIGWESCNNVEDAQAVWSYYEKEGRFEPFVIKSTTPSRTGKHFYWLCWWVIGTEDMYLQHRDIAMKNMSSPEDSYKVTFDIIPL